MIAWIHRNIPLVLATVLSLALHLAVLLPMLGGLGAGAFDSGDPLSAEQTEASAADDDPSSDERGDEPDLSGADRRREALERRAENARRALQEHRERQRLAPPEKREESIQLGIDESQASTMNWIGYAEYQRHLAELSEVEQAAHRLELATGSRGTASPLLPPAEPAPASAISPNPSPLPLPAAALGSDTAPPTNLVAQPQVAPASAPQPSPPTESARTAGSDAESARPLPLPEPNSTRSEQTSTIPSGEAPPTEPSATEADATASNPAQAPQPAKDSPEATPTPDGVIPTPNPADGARPTVPVPVPAATDPLAEPRTDPSDTPDPSIAEPSRQLDPAPPGNEPAAPLREGANPDTKGIKPITEAPESNRDPSAPEKTAETVAATNPASDATIAPATGAQGGGQSGPQPVDGAPSTPQTPSPAGAPGDTRSKSGDLADKESDPTSLIEVPMANWQNGKPLARQGITLKPVRPRFTTLNYLAGVGRNPIGEIVLGRDGVPQTARIVRSTGNASVDEAIRSALFRWRGSGKDLDRLAPGQTLTIRLRIIMLQD